MKVLFFVIVLFVAGAVGLGFWQGWFRIGSDSADGKDHITLTVDEHKLQEDRKKAQEKVQGLGHQVHDKAAGPADKGKD
jgi:hypothetical protein